MTIARKILRNTLWVMLSSLFSKVIGGLFLIYAARVLGPKDFGVFGLINAVIFIFSIVQNFGILPMGIRELAVNRNEAEALFSHIFSLRVLLSLCAFAILILFVHLLYGNAQIRTLATIAGFSLICHAFSGTFRILYTAFEKLATPSLVEAGVTVLHAAFGMIVLYLGYGILGLIWTGVIGNILGAALAGIWVRRNMMKYRFVWDLTAFQGLLKQSIPFALIGFARMADRYVNLILLSKSGHPPAVGYYHSATSLPAAMMLIPQSLRAALLPSVAANIHQAAIVRRAVWLNMKLLGALVCFPLILITTLIPEQLMVWLFGPAFRPAAPALTILGWAYAIRVGIAPMTIALSATHHIRRFLPWMILAAVLTMILAVILIPVFSFKGAAIAMLVSGVFRLLVNYFFFYDIFVKQSDGGKPADY